MTDSLAVDGATRIETVDITQLIFSDVHGYGAKGDGVADDTASIQACIDASSGIVFLPPGTYKTSSTLLLKAGTALVGNGAGISIIKGSAIRSVIKPIGISSFGIRDLTVTTNGTAGILGIEIDGCSYGSIQNVDVVDATYTGVYIARSSDISISNLKIRNVTMAAPSIGGTGLHLFDATTRVTVNGLIVDGTDGDAVWLDAQTTGGTPHPVTDCTFNGFVARNYGRVLNPSAGFGTHGAQRCSGAGWVIGPSYSPTTLQNGGIILNVDQEGVSTTDCVFSGITICNVGIAAIKILSAQRNQLSNVRVLNPDGALLNYAVIFDEGTMSAGVPPDNTDNVIDGLDVTTAVAPYSTNYNRTVLFNASAANCYRNRVVNLRPGVPLDVPIFWAGANAPSTGANANLAIYLNYTGAAWVMAGI